MHLSRRLSSGEHHLERSRRGDYRLVEGHALADVARTSVLFESAPLPPETSLRIRVLMKLSRPLLHAAYLRRYLQLRPATMEELETWRVPQRMAKSAWLSEVQKSECRIGSQRGRL